jgi:iron complex outermembrane recepter protein
LATTNPPQSTVCSIPNSNLIKGYTMVNARLGWRSADGDWTAALEIQNLTDKLYYMTIFDSTQSAGYSSGSPGLPRTFSFTVKRTF